MKNLMKFDVNVQNAFKGDNENLVKFGALLTDCARNTVKEYTQKEASERIVKKFKEVLGIEPTDKPVAVRRAIKANRDLVYTLMEETIDEMMTTGWMENPFFMAYVDTRNLALDDENDFYVEDDSILSVSKVSGNHHNIVNLIVFA